MSNEDVDYNEKDSSMEAQSRQTILGEYILGDKIGKGAFGVVRLATHIVTNEKVAIKQLEKDKIVQKADKLRIEREMKILQKLKHKNIIQLLEIIDRKTRIDLIMEYASGRELFDYINSKERLTELEACRFFQQIISGIEYLHHIGVVHRDIKPENLLLDARNNLKIVDFGLSNTYNKGEYLSTACGSPCYAAPEMLKGRKYKPGPVDIWASGIVLYAMICGHLPFQDNSNYSLYHKIIEGKFTIPDHVSEQGRSILRKILTTNPAQRVSIKQIKLHPWFNLVKDELNINEGLLLNMKVIPIDEELVSQMEALNYAKEDVRDAILTHKHNNITTTYYLLLKKKTRKGLPSVSDMHSQEFLAYIRDDKNLMSRYNNDNAVVLKERRSSKCRDMHIDKEEEDSVVNSNKISIKKASSNMIKYKTNETTSSPSMKKKKLLKFHSFIPPHKGFIYEKDSSHPQRRRAESQAKKQFCLCLSQRNSSQKLHKTPLTSQVTPHHHNNKQRVSTQGNVQLKDNPTEPSSKEMIRLTTELIDKIQHKILSKTKQLEKNNKKLERLTSSSNTSTQTIHDYIHTKLERYDSHRENTTIKVDTLQMKSKNSPPLQRMKPFYQFKTNSIKRKFTQFNNSKLNHANCNGSSNGKDCSTNSIHHKSNSLSISIASAIKPDLNAIKRELLKEKRINDSIVVNTKQFKDNKPKVIAPKSERADISRVNNSKANKSQVSSRIEITNSFKGINLSNYCDKADSSSDGVRICSTPFDLSCMIIKDIRELKEDISLKLTQNNIKFRLAKSNGMKFNCERKAISFEIEILIIPQMSNAYVLKVKYQTERGAETLLANAESFILNFCSHILFDNLKLTYL